MLRRSRGHFPSTKSSGAIAERRRDDGSRYSRTGTARRSAAHPVARSHFPSAAEAGSTSDILICEWWIASLSTKSETILATCGKRTEDTYLKSVPSSGRDELPGSIAEPVPASAPENPAIPAPNHLLRPLESSRERPRITSPAAWPQHSADARNTEQKIGKRF